MKRYFENLAKALLGQNYSALAENEQRVINSIAEHTTVSENVNDAYSDSLTTGQKIADVVARFGGSWWFISLFFMFIIAWIVTNSYLLIDQPFDPYPYILLNLGLSSLAAFQAPIIMMSQNRQAAKDRIKQDATFEINLKLELQVMRLHSKLDQLSETLAQSTQNRSGN
ncbi:DUF1003 domain-containing protein [Amphritea sp. 2_MG-2023]|jgi:uncharacterized membrane protein|uniref:DUF1003 domain-containing protein n=1 Tax=Amphritea TaxID=515417 RepID=UPI001C069E07|nr:MULTISPECIES: DUF1003 domain-containing protein [Amphritea]MBU2965934.1 DUF1003 domain-containing protein [Amphritea atlantica]MDO6418024.1 DUF1003 domain-containing protein [Amphritea sp. 2_MG-2023]